jgi:hypothetical protein
MADEIAAPAGNTTSTAAAASPAPVAAPAAAPIAAPAAAPAAPTAVVPGAAPASTEAPTAPTAPEKYDFASMDGKVNPAVLAKFEGVAREMNMTQAQAAKLLDTVVPEMAAAQTAQQTAAVASWAEAAKADKEFGGDNLAENLATAKKALDAFGSPELTQMLNATGLGNHPEIIRAFFRAGQKISSGNFVPSGQGATKAKDAGSTLYPSMN